MVALMLVPILGATALAVDVSYWYYKQRDMQNAADSAALAAARTADEDEETGDGTNDNFINIARGTAAEYGYVHGDGTVTVNATRVTCPSGDPGCTQVVIGYTSPLFFSPVVGFQGDQAGGQGVAALAVAGEQTSEAAYEFCVLALEDEEGVDGLLANGVPKADVNKCDIFSNSDMTCNGGNLNAGDAIAVGTSTGCGDNNVDGADPIADPYSDLAENIPENPCTSYPKAYSSGNNVLVDEAQNRLTVSSASGLSGEVIRCGDVVVGEDVTLNGVTLVIFNGRLITQNNTFAANGSTVVFSGSNDATYSGAGGLTHHYPTDTIKNSDLSDSVIEISSPASGDWSGVAIYQDPDVTTNVNIDQSGNAPAFNISGLFYAPNSDTQISGIINKAGSGYTCFVLVTNTLTINGTGQIFANALSECDQQGLDVPNSGATINKWLVK